MGHSAGAADVGIAAVRAPGAVRGVVFLDGDATPLAGPSLTLSHGITSMTSAQFAALKAEAVRKLVIAGASDPQISRADAAAIAARIGAPGPVYVPDRHLTMIASPRQVAAVISAFASAP